MAGSISLLIDSPLRDLAVALRAVGPDVRKRINDNTRAVAQPIWDDETNGRAMGRQQVRFLTLNRRVGVTSQNVLLRAGAPTPKGRSGANVTRATEFGGGAGKRIQSRSGKGTTYTRTLGPVFGPRYRKGRVAYPAASDSIPRFASLWVQTARRTIHEAIEEVS